MSSRSKMEQTLARVFSFHDGISTVVLDFANESCDGTPTREIWHQFERDVENILNDCALIVCDDKMSEVMLVRYGFARWSGYYKSTPRYLVCVIYKTECQQPLENALLEFSKAAEQNEIEILYDGNRHIDHMMANTEGSKRATNPHGSKRGIYRSPKIVCMKTLPECLDKQKLEALAALSLDEIIIAAKVRASATLISEVDQATFVDTITFGRVNISELEALRNIPCWIARDLSVSPKLIPGLYEKCKQIIGCAAIWHETLSAADILGYDLGVDPKTSKFDLDLFKVQTMETGVQYNIEAFLSGVPMADIIA